MSFSPKAAAFAVLSGVALAAPDCTNAPLLSPSECCTFTAPARFNATFVTTKGNFTAMSERAWGPIGVDRLYSLARCHFFDSTSAADNDAAFFRTIAGFVSQFGIPGNPAVSAAWANSVIANDPYPAGLSNTVGVLSYAAEQDPNTGEAFNRTTQLFVNLGNNSRLDAIGFTPVAVVDNPDGLAVISSLYSGYCHSDDSDCPDQGTLTAEGDAYLRANFPLLDYTTMTALTEW